MKTISSAMEPHLVQEFVRRLDEARGRVFQTVATTDEELATLEAHQAGSAIEDVPKDAAFARNLLPVTIGNVVGGALLVGGVYWFVYLRARGEP